MSLRTSPQADMAISEIEKNTGKSNQKCLQIREIPTSLCATFRNEMVFNTLEGALPDGAMRLSGYFSYLPFTGLIFG